MICSSVGITRFRLKPQVVSVQEGYVIFRFARVISFDQRPARLCENEGEDEDKDAVSHPSFYEKVDVLISQELKLHSPSFSEERLSSSPAS